MFAYLGVLVGHGSYTLEPVLKDHPFRHRNVVSQDRWSLVPGSIALKCTVLPPEMYGLSRQVVSHGSGLSRQVSLYML